MFLKLPLPGNQPGSSEPTASFSVSPYQNGAFAPGLFPKPNPWNLLLKLCLAPDAYVLLSLSFTLTRIATLPPWTPCLFLSSLGGGAVFSSRVLGGQSLGGAMSSCMVFRTELAVFDDGGKKTPAESCLKSSEHHAPAPCHSLPLSLPSLPLLHPSASLRTYLSNGAGNGHLSSPRARCARSHCQS